MRDTADLRERLGELHQRTAETPLFNPVFQLSLDLSRELEAGTIDLARTRAMVAELEAESLVKRAKRLVSVLAPMELAANRAAFASLAETPGDFESFAARWGEPLFHVVFTAHPTFLLTPAQSDAVAAAASSGDPEATKAQVEEGERPDITLAYEHAEAMAALVRAQDARDELNGLLFAAAAKRWPAKWRSLRPQPFRFASWVGYDMDGRTDIGWATSIQFRLQEKAMRLERYAAQLAGIDPAHEALAVLEAARDHADAMAAAFGDDLSAPDALSEVANRLTEEQPAKLTSLAPVIKLIEESAWAAPEARARDLLVLAAAMRADGLGMAHLHFRVNAKQLHNAIRRRIDPDNRLEMGSRTALKRMRALLAKVVPLRSNFAALATETTTAVRQFLVMAQILHHVDADTPIRMLVAECEQPQTVLAALYFSRMLGIDDRVDVSPLFETESAMEHGQRFLDALLAEPAYRDYARLRGRVAIQTGFSDAGRFVGQIPASLAIERLQGRLCRAMVRNELTDVAALIFNTHGESMGRGCHPASMRDRLTWPMSEWARARFAEAGIRTEIEASWQGGDGYLYFRTPELALATLVRIAEVETSLPGPVDDPFYTRTDLSLDLYRGVRRVQRGFMESRTYARSLTSFGLGLLAATGSRRARRQSDLASDRDMSLRQIRAIPHNAILQQLGYPANLIAGMGTAANEDIEGIAELIASSARGQQITRMLLAADRLGSIKSVAAYGELFNSAFWASRPYRGTERELESACLTLADQLTTDDRNSAFRTMTSRLRVDGVKLHRLLEALPDDPPVNGERERQRRSLGALQALRLALMQFMFLRAVRIPAFSRANDISREDVLQMVFSLRIEDALAQLRRAFKLSGPAMADYTVDEPADYPDISANSYAQLRKDLIEPIDEAYQLCIRIGIAIANHFGAHG